MKENGDKHKGVTTLLEEICTVTPNLRYDVKVKPREQGKCFKKQKKKRLYRRPLNSIMGLNNKANV